MRWIIADSHRDYFGSHSSILFEHFFTQEEVQQIRQTVESALSKKPKHLRDLSRSSPSLRKIVLQKPLARIAAELFSKKAIRFAYDQVITEGPFAPGKISSLQGLLGGVVIPLSPERNGDVIFFNTAFTFITETPDLFLVIAYAEPNTLYICNENDPHTHYLKSLGFTYGDRLNEKTHPIIYRHEL